MKKLNAKDIVSASKAAQNHAALVRAGAANAALGTRDMVVGATNIVVDATKDHVVPQAKRVGAYVGSFIRTLVSR